MRVFVKFKQIQKSEKNTEVGGWVKPQLGILFFWKFCVLCGFFVVVVHVFQKKLKLDRGVRGWGLANPSFSQIFGFFLT